MPTAIYALCHPVSLDVRYIGKTINAKLRLRQHIHNADKDSLCHYPLYRWITKIKKEGLLPVIKVLAIVPDDLYALYERIYIKHYRSITRNLLNITDGGQGQAGRQFSEETRRKIATKARGRRMTNETREKISRSRLGQKQSTEVAQRSREHLAKHEHKRIEAVRKANMGKPMSEEAKAKSSASQKNKPRWTEEQKRQMSIDRKGRRHRPESIEKMKGNKNAQSLQTAEGRAKMTKIMTSRSPEIYEKITEKNKGKKRTLEQRERMSQAQKLWRAGK